MDLRRISGDIYKILEGFNVFLDELPCKDENGTELDYINNIYATYSLGSISDFYYKNIIDLEIQVVTDKVNKFEAQRVAELIDKMINKKTLTGARVNRKNAYLTQFIDDEGKQNIILQYNINKF